LIELLAELEKQLLALNAEHVELVTVLPIEDESRRLPKTGYYKDTPFYGTRAERQGFVRTWNDELRRIVDRHPTWSLFEWPKRWYEMDGVEFFQYMERPASVHLARKYYRWDLVNDRPNPNLEPKATSLLEF
jgi:hypothetical protein